MSKDRSVYARHILDCIERIESYVVDGREAFLSDPKTQDAVVRNLEVIGQAVKDLGTDALAGEQPDIPWKRVGATRNVLAHQYLGVDLKLIWAIVEKDLPKLKSGVADLARRLGSV